MCQNCLVKTIHSVNSHFGWDNSIEPTAWVAPGAMLEFCCLDSSNGFFTPDSKVADVGKVPFDKINPVTGPIFVEGAEPGDVLKITLDSFKPSGFGWTANIPGFGLLADQFQDPALMLWHYDKLALTPAAFSDFAKVPLKPFAGTIGLAPALAGLHSVVPPRRVGGNLDIRDLAAGTTLYLPVEVSGALLSIGDTHAAQGDGEVCGTAIESAMDVVVKLDLIKNTPLATPRFSTPGPVTRHLDSAGYEAFTGIGPDLMQAARQAVSNTIDWLCREHHMPAEQAYMLCSVCGDLRISEIVDMPNWVVSFYFPKVVFA
ncbi:Acetamidase/formamidase [Pseudomonas sp. ok272]|uniref:acetamidase/formamidase family protein n=1 Tax=unclassified Pseudomonas TaxID=196821 RepID=UPI0008D52E04|nr:MULTISPECIES: acetamidase/formamidase family protein [unclassified Pseudomonas]SEN42565.1 Acetamidase/formamidase [Pseudomonas sp. ok272]SFN25796.1 Acetamidase/formamidase [Pseudomonas sp. ok602]